ncbi:hypothetical protein C8Q80DRAFT_87018 [Daedaleopsis nitida]|nr:hypothetical protein C8Q80DRAFT_87018 [Daedaleopsis nitida]
MLTLTRDGHPAWPRVIPFPTYPCSCPSDLGIATIQLSPSLRHATLSRVARVALRIYALTPSARSFRLHLETTRRFVLTNCAGREMGASGSNLQHMVLSVSCGDSPGRALPFQSEDVCESSLAVCGPCQCGVEGQSAVIDIRSSTCEDGPVESVSGLPFFRVEECSNRIDLLDVARHARGICHTITDGQGVVSAHTSCASE